MVGVMNEYPDFSDGVGDEYPVIISLVQHLSAAYSHMPNSIIQNLLGIHS